MGRTKRRRRKKSDFENSVKRLDPDSRIIELLKWLGIKTNLHLFHFPNAGRGLRTSNTIRANDYLIRVPLKKMITRSTVQDQYPSHWSTQLMLTCFILENNRKFSTDWSIYKRTLPESYDVPYFDCPDEDIIESLPLFLRNQIRTQSRLIHKQYKLAKSVVQVDEKTFAWAWFSVNTRGVYYPDGHDNLALAPYLDMFNHNPEVEVKIEIIDSHYHIRSLQDWGKHDQVFINYGPHDNTKLYVEYGFVLQDHPYDSLPLTLEDLLNVLKERNNKDTVSEKKIQTIQQHKLDQNLRIFKNDEIVSWSVLACLYILILDETSTTTNVFEQDLQLTDFLTEIQSLLERQVDRIRKAQQKCCILQKEGVSTMKNEATPTKMEDAGNDNDLEGHASFLKQTINSCQQPSVLPVLLDIYYRLCEQGLKQLKLIKLQKN